MPEDDFIIDIKPDDILVCDLCNLPITDRKDGMDIAITDLYWMNWGIVDRTCYSSTFRKEVESGKTELKLIKVFKKGQDVSEVRNHGTLTPFFLCQKCKTIHIMDSVIDRKDKFPETFTCRVCGFVIDTKAGEQS